MTALSRENAYWPRISCDWCCKEGPCEPARAGTGNLWICNECAEHVTAACDHDWRLDPAGPVYTSDPPCYRVVCAACGATEIHASPLQVQSTDPRDWPKEADDAV